MADPILEIGPGLYALKPSARGLEGEARRLARSAAAKWGQWHRRREAIDYLGGRCCKCAFQGHMAAFHIHHTDPTMKSTGRDRGTVFAVGGTSRLHLTEEEKRELDTCELHCANCHAIESAGSTNPYHRFVDTTAATVGGWDPSWNTRLPGQEDGRQQVRPSVAEGNPDAN